MVTSPRHAPSHHAFPAVPIPMAQLVQLSTLCLLAPHSADAYSRGAGSCHTASGGHGEATPGDGGFTMSLVSAATPGSTLTLRLAHAQGETQFKGFLVKVTGPGGGYDDGGASFTGLDDHALAQSKNCYGPTAATHRSSDPKDAVELQLSLPPEPVELVATVVVMISRQSTMDSEWYTWTVPISVAAQDEPQPQPVRCRPDGSRCPLILSLQPQDEWDAGHVSCAHRALDGTAGVDDPALGVKALELAGGDTTTPIVTYCYSGNELVFGMFVLPTLTEAGFTDVVNGGAWVEPSSAVSWNNDVVLEELCVCDTPAASEDGCVPAAADAVACPSDVVRAPLSRPNLLAYGEGLRPASLGSSRRAHLTLAMYAVDGRRHGRCERSARAAGPVRTIRRPCRGHKRRWNREC